MREFRHGTYKYKGVLYETLRSGTDDGLCRMKNQASREWVESVLYTCKDNALHEVYCRELKEFVDRFEFVE